MPGQNPFRRHVTHGPNGIPRGHREEIAQTRRDYEVPGLSGLRAGVCPSGRGLLVGRLSEEGVYGVRLS